MQAAAIVSAPSTMLRMVSLRRRKATEEEPQRSPYRNIASVPVTP
jgi:hypothetical protein